MSLPKLIRIAAFLCLARGFVSAMPTAGQQKKVDCSKPPAFIPASEESKKQNEARAAEKHLKSPVTGTVAVEINETGDVVEYLASAAKLMKFKPRPGCASKTIVVTFHIGDERQP